VGILVGVVVCDYPGVVVWMVIDLVGIGWLYVCVVRVVGNVDVVGGWVGFVGSRSTWDGGSIYAPGGDLGVGSMMGCWSICVVCMMRCSYVVVMFGSCTVTIVDHIWLDECPSVGYY